MKSLQHKRGTAAILTANNPTLLAGEYGIETDTGKVKIGDGSTAWASLGYAFSSAANLSAGTLPDARLSSNVATYASLLPYLSFPSAGIDIFPRGEANNVGMAPGSGQVYFSFFTPHVTTTVTSITMSSGNTAGASLTLARMGVYTFDETTAVLVARTASDTTLFTTVNTTYQRSFSSVGGFPTNYTLTAGTRYGVAVLSVGTTLPNYAGKTVAVGIASLTPRAAGNVSSQSDLPTTATGFGTNQGNLFARLS